MKSQANVYNNNEVFDLHINSSDADWIDDEDMTVTELLRAGYFPLLALPTELRTHVFEAFFQNEDPLWFGDEGAFRRRSAFRQRRVPSLFFSNKQVYKEALSVRQRLSTVSKVDGES